MSKKTIYQYFSGKEEIAASAIETVMGRISEQFDRLKLDDEDPISELRSSLEQVKAEVARLNLLWKIFKNFCLIYGKKCRNSVPEIMQIESSIRAAQKAGMTTDLDARLVTVIFLETVQSLIRLDSLSRHGFTATEAISALIDIFMTGITREPHNFS